MFKYYLDKNNIIIDNQEIDLNVGSLTFGKTAIRWSQIAAITFKERFTI